VEATLRTDEWTKVNPIMGSLIFLARVIRSLRQWGSRSGKTPVDEFGHEVEGTGLGFGTAGARGEGRAESVEHRGHLVANVTEVMGPVNRDDQKHALGTG
jgi:hypothetical protein